MIRKLLKYYKIKKEIDNPLEAIHDDGVLNGYTCPRCKMKHCIYDFCLACGQRLHYDYKNNFSFEYRFLNVDEMCEKLDAIEENKDIEVKNQYEKLFGEKPQTLKQLRKKYKIELLELELYE